MSKENTLRAIIQAYRQIIDQRYQFRALQKQFPLPDSVDEALVNRLREYFLNYIYPPAEKRAELDLAFASLDNYLQNPGKLLRLLLESFKISLKHGRHLPKILTAGLKAFHSFRAATHFENQLVEKAMSLQMEGPLTESDIYTMIGKLPREEIDEFIESTTTLFETIHDRVLVEKVKEILGYLIIKMEKDPQHYSAEEVRGLEIGLEILVEGDHLFRQLNPLDQERLVPLVVEIETKALDAIFMDKK